VESVYTETSPLTVGIFLLIFLSCIVGIIKGKREEAREREFQSELSKLASMQALTQALVATHTQSGLRTKPKTPPPAPTLQPEPAPEPQYTTSNEIMQEAITALVKMGHAKTSAKKIVSELCESSTFNSSEELFQAAFFGSFFI